MFCLNDNCGVDGLIKFFVVIVYLNILDAL
jgi:hypothetical protein